MHGIIFAELRNYAETKHGKGTWNQLLKKAGLDNRVYLPIKAYPDTEVVGLIEAASTMVGLPVAEVLEDFGEFIAPALMKMFGHLLLPIRVFRIASNCMPHAKKRRELFGKAADSAWATPRKRRGAGNAKS